MNGIENKKSKDLINKKINDIVNNIKPFKIDYSIGKDDSEDKNIFLIRKNARNLADKLNQEDEIDYDELAELTKAKLALGELKPLEPLKPINLSIRRASDLPINVPIIQK